MFIDPPCLTTNDIIPLINMAWNASLTRIDKNKKAIAERGWGALNRNLLLYKEIQHTMTREDSQIFQSMQRSFQQPDICNTFMPSFETVAFPNPSEPNNSIISDLNNQEQTCQETTIVSLNYSSGNSAMVLETLVGAHDLNEARERNKLNKTKGSDVADVYKKAKAVTGMFHFNEYGCKVGKIALDKKKDLFQVQQQKILDARKKEEEAYNER